MLLIALEALGLWDLTKSSTGRPNTL